MKNESHIEALDQQDISEVELNNVIDANKDLYDKLNELPEIEALDSLVEEGAAIGKANHGRGGLPNRLRVGAAG